MIYDIVGVPSHLMDNVDNLVQSDETSITFSLQNSNGNNAGKKHKLLSTKSQSCDAQNEKNNFTNSNSQSCSKHSDQCFGVCECDLRDFNSSEPLKRFKFQSDKEHIFEVISFINSVLSIVEYPKFTVNFLDFSRMGFKNIR